LPETILNKDYKMGGRVGHIKYLNFYEVFIYKFHKKSGVGDDDNF
jgi:hypothetical protein